MASSNSKKRKAGVENPPHISAFAALAARNGPRTIVRDPDLASPKRLPLSGPDHSELSRSQRKIEESVDDSPVENDQVVAKPTIFQLSTVRASQIMRSSKSSLKVLLEPGDRLVALGQYDFSVDKGCIKILGANLRASSTRYHVDAPSSHCLPVIRCDVLEIEAAEISLHQSSSGLEKLNQLSPLFRKIWSDSLSSPDCEDVDSAPESDQRTLDMGSFHILFSIIRKNVIRPIISPPEWNALLSKLQNLDTQKPPIILVCGPRSTGKSTFSKLLTNRIITSREVCKNASKKSNDHGVVVLDCDPGQPEYSIPGQLSLTLLKEPNFGPPISHPTILGARNKLIHSHSIAAFSPSNDPELYMSCVLDLLNQYQSHYSTHSLVINTPGLILGTELEILVELIQRLNPTAVVYMSQDGPLEAIESLTEAAKSIPLYTLPSQGSESAVRNPTSLRAMQTMSYFHLRKSSNSLSWDPTPLSSLPPLQIRYSGKNAGILCILCLGDQPPPELVAEVINGSILAIVVIDDLAAIPNSNSDHPDDLETSHVNSIIARTPKEQIPYFTPRSSMNLDPRYSHTIGCLLVRGIDIQHRRLQVLTPIAPQVFQEIREAGKAIVLVNGKLENPGWAFTEELYKQSWMDREDSTSEDTGAEAGAFENAPWVEKLHGGKGREGGKVWKVRRDLGRKGGEG